MFECQICGLLSLGGSACPACGSQLRTDLASDIDSDEVLPSDVPGLDDAAAAWYDLEGIEPPTDEPPHEESSSKDGAASSLPFGFQGQSKVYTSRLPFGIGSFAEGIPFEAQGRANDVELHPSSPALAEAPTQASVPTPTPTPTPTPATPTPPLEPDVPASPPEAAEPSVTSAPPAPSATSETPPATVEASSATPASQSPPPAPSPPPVPVTVGGHAAPVRLQSARLVQPSEADVGSVIAEQSPSPSLHPDVGEVPDYWRIDAPIPNYEEIYDQQDEVVEVTFNSLEDDVVVYDHASDSPAAVFHSPLEATPVAVTSPSVSLTLHPVQALNVDVGGSAELAAQLSEGFAFMQQGAWSSAARTFQRMAASLPTSPEVFNNYGISLLQRAVGMRDGPDPEQHRLSEAQFESAILALREAAKGAPTNGDVLINLACALIESGRSEKALGIMNVHNARSPGSSKGINTAAVAMFNLGQLSQAAATLQKASDDVVAAQNLAKLSPA